MKWHLTQPEPDRPEIDIREDDEDEPHLGYAYMRALAQADDNGVWVDTGSGPGIVRYAPRGVTPPACD